MRYVWRLRTLDKNTYSAIADYSFCLQKSQSSYPHERWQSPYPMKSQRKILLFIFTSLKFIMLIWANFIRFMLLLISLFHQIEEPLQSQRRCWLLTCVNYLGFFLEECSKVGVLSVSVAWRRIWKYSTGTVIIRKSKWWQNFSQIITELCHHSVVYLLTVCVNSLTVLFFTLRKSIR